jgi:molybdopterin molybdotransferase
MTPKPMGLRSWRDLAAGIEAQAEPVRETETISAQAAPGRVLATTVRAARPLPAGAHAVMDGFALGSAPPGRYRILPGRQERLAIDEAAPVAAGEPVPLGAAAVALAARVLRDGDRLTVTEARRQDNIRRAGEEAASGDALIAAGTRLDARHVALAAAAGVTSFTVRRRIELASLALDESVEPLPHAILLSALLASPAVRMPETQAVREAQLAEVLARHAGRRDLVLVVAQSLDGEDAPLARAIRAAGGSVAVGRAAIKPAKPILHGRIGGALVLGFAGTAYAVAVASHLILRPLLRRLAGLPGDDPLRRATADFAREREPGRAEALPARVSGSGPDLRLALAGRFGQLSALAALDGFALVEAEAGDIRPGDPLLYQPLSLPLL